MHQHHFLLPLLLVALVSACVIGDYPKTPDEYRSAMQQRANTMGVRVENFVIPRPILPSAQFVKKKSEECLRHTIRVTSSTSSGGMMTSYSDNLVKYEPKAEISATKASVYLTETYMNLKGETIQGPYFTYLMDFKPLAGNKTKVDLYYTWGEPRPTIVKAVKAWASGTDVGCPNLAKR